MSTTAEVPTQSSARVPIGRRRDPLYVGGRRPAAPVRLGGGHKAVPGGHPEETMRAASGSQSRNSQQRHGGRNDVAWSRWLRPPWLVSAIALALTALPAAAGAAHADEAAAPA